jgi:hypothetical protein
MTLTAEINFAEITSIDGLAVDDLTALLRRISQREQTAASRQTTLPQAA